MIGKLALIAAAVGCGVWADEFEDKLNAAEKATTAVMDSIYSTWEIEKYPDFLKASWMPRHSWDHMVAKFEHRILDTFASKKSKNFTISFTGSSVTAGHDSPFQVSYPVVAGILMAPAFAPLDITLVSNNDAMGNNPCMPYDACVATYAGLDADIVHWEQQFNCFIDGDPRMVEQFVRQAAYLPKNPLVIIAGSITPNWHPGDCEKVKTAPVLSPEETARLGLVKKGDEGRMEIFTEANKNDRSNFPHLHSMLKTYPSAGIQSFDHAHYDKYKCFGPYVPTWGDGVASWHPSLNGHKLRAHHYSYVWLTAFHMATVKVLAAYKKGDKVPDMLKSVGMFLDGLKPKYPLSKPVSPSQNVPDDVQCLTTFEPHQYRDRSLAPLIVSGLQSQGSGGWLSEELEELLDPNIVKKARIQGYLDKKTILYATKAGGPLNIKVTIKKEGLFFICEAPGVWGALPPGFVHLWEGGTKAFLSPVDGNPDNFKFDEEKAAPHRKMIARVDTDEICVHLEGNVKPGKFVLTILNPSEEHKIAVSTLLVP
jgi:hypothetical protein